MVSRTTTPPSRAATAAKGVVAALAAGVLATTATPTAAQAPPPSVTHRDVTGTCGSASVTLDGTVEMSLGTGDEVTGDYRVTAGDQLLDLPSTAVPATASVSTALAWSDDVLFGPRWVEAFPFTYTMDTGVTSGGELVHLERLEATCTAAGTDAQITVTVLDPASPTEPTTPAGPMAPTGPALTPRFTG